jgi:hypothetical protein
MMLCHYFKVKKGPDKGKMIEVLKRDIPLEDIKQVCMR